MVSQILWICALIHLESKTVKMTGGLNRLGIVLAGPTSDYGYTSFGSDVTTPGYVSENPVPTASCSSDGTCQYTFTHAVPANATGTYAIGIEGRRVQASPACAQKRKSRGWRGICD